MNRTKKLTTGAMLLAIVMALLEVDKRLAMFLFSPMLSLLFAVVIIMYATMYTIKDGILLGVGLLIMSFVLGDPAMILYYPINIIVGIGYAFELKRNAGKRKLMLTAMVLFIIGELLVAYALSPLILNIPVSQQIAMMKESLVTTINSMESSMATDSEAARTVFDSYRNISISMLTMVFAVSIIAMGLMEGLIIHIASLTLLKKFKIKTVEGNAFELKPNKPLAYVSMILVMVNLFGRNYLSEQSFYPILAGAATFAALILLFYGYTCLILYGRLVLKRNLTLLAIIFVFIPIFWTMLIIIGFLFSSGPLYDKLMSYTGEKS